jgi:hypothetical protein
VASAQCLTYLIVGNHFLEIEGLLFHHWIWMTLTALIGTGMALLVSALVKSERAALTAVPLLLVPQMLLAGALIPFKEMNRALFDEAKIERERGGIPVPAYLMPLRYAYEGMIVAQATRNPFELERIRLQRKIDNAKEIGNDLSEEEMERFEMVKEGLRRLLASGASNEKEAHTLVKRIRKLVNEGTPIEVATMKVWPDEGMAYPAYSFYVNERIDLLIREAETFRNDYRNKTPRNIFLALKKPFPFIAEPIETMRYNGAFLISITLLCGISTAWIIGRQNRSVK